jgi:hypothetical protein
MPSGAGPGAVVELSLGAPETVFDAVERGSETTESPSAAALLVQARWLRTAAIAITPATVQTTATHGRRFGCALRLARREDELAGWLVT